MRLNHTCGQEAIRTLSWERPRSCNQVISTHTRSASLLRLIGHMEDMLLLEKALKRMEMQRFRVTVCDPAARQRRGEVSLLHRSSFNVLGASDRTRLGVSYRTRNVPFPPAISLAEPIQAALICFMDHWTFSRVRPRCATDRNKLQVIRTPAWLHTEAENVRGKTYLININEYRNQEKKNNSLKTVIKLTNTS